MSTQEKQQRGEPTPNRQTDSTRTERQSFRQHVEQAARIERLVENGEYESKSEAFRDLLDRGLNTLEASTQAGGRDD